MNRVIRRIVLSIVALSPSVAFLTVQEVAISVAFLMLGVTGAVSAAVAITAVTPKVSESLAEITEPNTEYPSLLTKAALTNLQNDQLQPVVIQAKLRALLEPRRNVQSFVTEDDQVAVILTKIMAQWGVADVALLNDDQSRELWFIEKLLRSTPAEAGALASSFTTPNAMLAMRDRVANGATA